MQAANRYRLRWNEDGAERACNAGKAEYIGSCVITADGQGDELETETLWRASGGVWILEERQHHQLELQIGEPALQFRRLSEAAALDWLQEHVPYSRWPEAALALFRKRVLFAARFAGEDSAPGFSRAGGVTEVPTFDDSHFAITLGGVRHEAGDKTSYRVFKAIVEARPDAITASGINVRVPGAGDKKRIARLLKKLPRELYCHVLPGDQVGYRYRPAAEN